MKGSREAGNRNAGTGLSTWRPGASGEDYAKSSIVIAQRNTLGTWVIAAFSFSGF